MVRWLKSYGKGDWKMKVFKNILLIMTFAVLTLGGCSQKENANTPKQEADNTTTRNSEVGENSVSEDNEIKTDKNNETENIPSLDEAIKSGMVVELSDLGFEILPVTVDKDEIAMPVGEEEQSGVDKINVNCSSEVKVRIAEYDTATGENNYLESDINDIKKDSSVYIYGEYVNETEIKADQIIIFRVKKSN